MANSQGLIPRGGMCFVKLLFQAAAKQCQQFVTPKILFSNKVSLIRTPHPQQFAEKDVPDCLKELIREGQPTFVRSNAPPSLGLVLSAPSGVSTAAGWK